MDDARRMRILDQIVTATALPQPIGEDEVTITQLAEYKSVSYCTAKRMIDTLVKAGQMTRRETIVGGRRTWVYRMVADGRG